MCRERLAKMLLCSKYGLPEDAVIQTSNFIGFMLEEAVKWVLEDFASRAFRKIIKVAGGLSYP